MIKIMDLIWCNERKITGQVMRLRSGIALIYFATGETIRYNIKDIKKVNGQWRMND